MLSRITRLSSTRMALQRRSVVFVPKYNFSSEVQATESEQPQQERSISEHNKIVGADTSFNQQKHGYILSFPWNFEQVINDFEKGYRPMSTSSYWHQFMTNSRSIVEFNNLFREFHQACAIPDHEMIARVCEPRLANYVSDSVKRIHFHGLDIEMANMTVEQPSIQVLKAEVHQGLSINRDENH